MVTQYSTYSMHSMYCFIEIKSSPNRYQSPDAGSNSPTIHLLCSRLIITMNIRDVKTHLQPTVWKNPNPFHVEIFGKPRCLKWRLLLCCFLHLFTVSTWQSVTRRPYQELKEQQMWWRRDARSDRETPFRIVNDDDTQEVAGGGGGGGGGVSLSQCLE